MENESLILKTLANIQTQMDQKFELLQTQMNEGFTKVDERFNKVDEKFTKVDEKFTKVDEKFTKIDERFNKIDDRQILLENQQAATHKMVSDFIGAQKTINKDVAESLNRIEAKVDNLALQVISHEVMLKQIK